MEHDLQTNATNGPIPTIESRLYRCSGHRATRAWSIGEAATIFALREARTEFGRGGYVRTVRRDSWAQDGSSVTFEAFIGYSVDKQTTSGHNIWITVHRA